MEAETVKIVLVGALLLGAASLLVTMVWSLVSGAYWGKEQESRPLTRGERERLEETMSSKLGWDWREKILVGEI